MTQLPSTVNQNADVRFLGRLLGDIIRTYGGQADSRVREGIELSINAIGTALRNSG